MNLDDLDRLAVWMRNNGARRARCGDLELELGPKPQREEPPGLPPTDEEVVALLEKSRKQQEALLFASSEGFPDFDE